MKSREEPRGRTRVGAMFLAGLVLGIATLLAHPGAADAATPRDGMSPDDRRVACKFWPPLPATGGLFSYCVATEAVPFAGVKVDTRARTITCTAGIQYTAEGWEFGRVTGVGFVPGLGGKLSWVVQATQIGDCPASPSPSGTAYWKVGLAAGDGEVTVTNTVNFAPVTYKCPASMSVLVHGGVGAKVEWGVQQLPTQPPAPTETGPIGDPVTVGDSHHASASGSC